MYICEFFASTNVCLSFGDNYQERPGPIFRIVVEIGAFPRTHSQLKPTVRRCLIGDFRGNLGNVGIHLRVSLDPVRILAARDNF